MAWDPPFQVEDQTDEDFFDKLVDDDDEFKVTAPTLNNFADGSDSDEAKAFANLSIGDVDTRAQDSGGSEGVTEGKGEADFENVNAVTADGNVEESSTKETSHSFHLDTMTEPSGTELETEVNSHSMISRSNGSPGSSVKEVQWAAFNTDLGPDGSNGFGSYSEFLSELGDGTADQLGKEEDHFGTGAKIGTGTGELKTSYDENNYNSVQYEESIATEAVVGRSADGQVVNNVQYWENQYPGWKFDVNTGQWYQVDGYDTAGNVQGTSDTNHVGAWAVSDGNSQITYLQQTAQSSVGTVTDSGTTESVTKWNQSSHESGMIESVSNWNQVSIQRDRSESVSNWDQISTVNNGYPAHMVFDPQYPGWYYDTIAQEWRSLEFYTSPIQSSIEAHDQPNQNIFGSAGSPPHENGEKHFGDYGHVDNYGSQGIGVQNQGSNWAESYSNYNKQSSNTRQPENFSGNRQLTFDYGSKFSVTSHVSQQKSYENVAQSEASGDFSGNQQLTYDHGSKFSVTNQVSQQKSYDSSDTVPFYENVAQSHNDFSRTGSQGFVPTMSFHQPVNQPFVHQNEQMKASNDYYGNENSLNPTLPQFQNGHQFSYAPTAGRSSADRPPHALVTFGFGGKLIFMKSNSYSSSSSYGSQGSLGGTISVVNMMEVVTEISDPSSMGVGAADYISTLCRRSFPGPLVGGNAGSKELNKWIDEKVASCDSPNEDYRKGEVFRLLFSLLKIACQYYGKLRSPFGSEAALRESDAPESAVARLFASAKRNAVEYNNYNTLGHFLHKLPSEEQMRATAAEVQRLLVSGKKKEALHFASEGQLWGPALVLAAQLGDQFYGDTVKQMALRQLVAGSPLRTLCLLIAGQPADVFSTDPSANMFSQPTQYGIISMLDYWEENLAVIAANRTKDDELVLIHLGDCLWKDRSEIIAAHICYLVAEANFEPYSDSARLCLVGADHLKHPRTFASPEAIQRTELYEYSKVLGNPQFILLPFQPYKLIYAHMLAEVGKVTESLKYCQAVLKSLKTGRAPEMDTLRQLVSALEERLRTHQQGGYSSNLAPAKIVGKLLNLFDSTAHRVVGGLPPPIPSTSHSSASFNEHNYHQPMGHKVSTSQSTMAMSSLMPSASMEPISEWTAEGNRKTMHSRSVSEPDFGRTPRQDDSSKEVTSSIAQGKALVSGGTSRFGRFGLGSQLLQKTVGLVLKPRQDRQAKLGEKNRFYYDEKLKRWVEEGAELPAEEAAPPPPPTIAAFQNGMSDYYLTSAVKSEGSLSNGSPEFWSPTSSELSSGIPPIPTATNQFSARGRMGVRSRYVDTFNKGGGNPANLFQSPAVPSIKPATGSNPKFFVPSLVSSGEHSHETTKDIVQETTSVSETSSIPTLNNSLHSPPHSVTMQRFPSMDNISTRGKITNGSGSISSHSRRTASWSGSLNNASSLPKRTEVKPLGEVLGMSPSLFVPNEPSVVPLTRNSGSFGEDLHEVEL